MDLIILHTFNPNKENNMGCWCHSDFVCKHTITIRSGKATESNLLLILRISRHMYFVQIFVNLKSEHIIFGSMCCSARFTLYLSAIVANYTCNKCMSCIAQFITSYCSHLYESCTEKSSSLRVREREGGKASEEEKINKLH